MASRRFDTVLQHIRQLIRGPMPDESDGDLLTRFATRQDEAAFETLLARHGPMVLQVARRVLHHAQDAEDVFQVTFVVLAQQAHSIRKTASVASWLYGVAHRTALRARSRRLRRSEQEKAMAASTSPEGTTAMPSESVEPLLGEEVNRLPEKFRSAVVLCYFEGKSREEAARALGWSTDTVKGRLERGRDLLRKRLVQRGVALSAAALATALEQSAVAGTVPATLMNATLRLAILGGADAGTALTAPAAALLNGVLNEMYWNKLKMTVATLLGVAILAGSTGWLAHRTFAGSSDGAMLALAPDPVRGKPVEEREVKLAIDRAVVHKEAARDQPENVAVVANSWGDHRVMGTALTEATALAKEGKPRLPIGGNLSVLSMGPVLDSPDQVNVERFVRRGQRLVMEVNYTNARAEGVPFLQNLRWKPLVHVPIDLPVGDYDLEVSWHAVAYTPPTGKFQPQPVKTQKIAFTIFEGLAYSKPNRVGDREFATFVDARVVPPPAGGKRPMNFGVRVTNHGKEPIELSTPSLGRSSLTPVEGKPLEFSGGRDGLRARKPVTVLPGQTMNLFMYSAELVWDKDGKVLNLSGMDCTAFFFVYKEFRAGKYTLRLNIPGGEGLTEPVTFEVGEKP